MIKILNSKEDLLGLKDLFRSYAELADYGEKIYNLLSIDLSLFYVIYNEEKTDIAVVEIENSSITKTARIIFCVLNQNNGPAIFNEIVTIATTNNCQTVSAFVSPNLVEHFKNAYGLNATAFSVVEKLL